MGDNQLHAHRLIIAVLALLVIVSASAAIILAWTAPDSTISGFQDSVDFLANHNDSEGKLILTLAAVVVILVAASVLIVELVPPSNQLHVPGVESGVVAITTSQVAERIDAEVASVDHVAGCTSSVTRKGKRVEVVLDLKVGPGADLADTANEACRRAHLLVEQQLGIELVSRPRARIHYHELRLGREPAQERPPTGWERPQDEGGT